MSGPEFNPADDEPIDREAWEAFERKQRAEKLAVKIVQTIWPFIMVDSENGVLIDNLKANHAIAKLLEVELESGRGDGKP